MNPRKENRGMETTADGTFFQEGDLVRLKHTTQTGRINATAGGVAYVLMDGTNESRLFAVYADADTVLELVPQEERRDERDSSPYSELLSERWLLERTYHACLSTGRELPVALFTEAMKRLSDFSFLAPAQSWRSQLPELLASYKSANFYVPLSTWHEITAEEARAAHQQGSPLLLYNEYTWQHSKRNVTAWRPNRNSRIMIFGSAWMQAEAHSGSDASVCYLDRRHGTFSNDSWKAWFPSESASLFGECDLQGVIFLSPSFQFPYTTHYTVVSADGRIQEYADRAEALQGFSASPLQEIHSGNAFQMSAPHFCYYHEIRCPGGVYRLEFFGPRMDEQGYLAPEPGGEKPCSNS